MINLSLDLPAYLDALQLPLMGRRYIEVALTSPPARRVQGRIGNVTCRFVSVKNGCTQDVESQAELAVAYELEHDEHIRGFRSQPPSIRVRYRTWKGATKSFYITPDFLSLADSGVGWIEVKEETELVRRAERMPGCLARGDDGEWRFPPGEEVARDHGFFFRMRSTATINFTLVRNQKFLNAYRSDKAPAPKESVRQQIVGLVKSRPGITACELAQLCSLGTMDDLWWLVVSNQIYTNLERVPLAEVSRVQLFANSALAKAFANLLAASSHSGTPYLHVEGQLGTGLAETATTPDPTCMLPQPDVMSSACLVSIGAESATPVVAQPASPMPEALQARAEGNPQVKEIILRTSFADLEIANRRFQIIHDPELARQLKIPERTLRRWKARSAAAETRFSAGFVGLIPRTRDRGNRTSPLTPAVLDLANVVIRDHYFTLKRKRKIAAYGVLLRECEKQGLTPPCYAWFAKEIKKRDLYETTRLREGPRSAYQIAPPVTVRSADTHGDFAWAIGHIDHTPPDLVLVDGDTGAVLEGQWLSVLIDGYSRRPLAWHIGFQAPSADVVMCLLRECVRLHNRLPETIVTDNGPEFGSVLFQVLLARYEVVLKKRPSARPRFGSILEKFFGTTTTQLFNSLAGNTQALKIPRVATKGTLPQAHAVWSLERLHDLLAGYFAHYEQQVHLTLGVTPMQRYLQGLKIGGARPQRHIPYDEEFIMHTLPSTSRGTARVIPGRGVKYHHVFYYNPAFRSAAVQRKQVPIRVDPMDIGRIYARVDGKWVQCISQFHAILAGRSEKEIALASAAIRQRTSNAMRKYFVTAKRLAEFLESPESEEPLLLQRRKDLALRNIISKREGGAMSPGQDNSQVEPSPAIGTASEPGSAKGPLPDETYDDL